MKSKKPKTIKTKQVPEIPAIQQEKKVHVPATIRKPGDLSLRSKFTKEMAQRAKEDGIHPLEFLAAVAMDPSLTFTDWFPSKGDLIQIERTATINERIDCAKTVLPYIETKKVEVAHSGQIQVLHALAENPLDSVLLDESGRVIEDDDILDAEIE